jgi:hypothetical protein
VRKPADEPTEEDAEDRDFPRAVEVAVSGMMTRGKPMKEAWTTPRNSTAVSKPTAAAPRNEWKKRCTGYSPLTR